MIMWLKSNGTLTFGCKCLTVCHHPAKFGDRRHCDNGDTFIICHVTSRDNVYKVSCDFIKPLTIRHHPARFGGHRRCDRGDLRLLICQVTTRYYYP